MKPEGRFKQRADRTAQRIAKTAGLSVEYGDKAGDPDKIYKFGTVWLAVEHKRAGKAPRRLQEYRLAELEKLGLPGCALVATEGDDFTQEKQDFYTALYEAVSPDAVQARIDTYVKDASDLRTALETLIDA